MDGFLIGGVILVVVLVLWLALQSLQSRQKDGAIESQMNELRRDLQTIATSQAQSTGKLEAIAKSVAQRLDSVTPALQDAIRNSAQITGQMTSDAQTKMADELKNTRDQISQIQRQLGEVQLAGKQMSQTAQTLEGILGGDRKSTRLNSSHSQISYAVFCLKNKDMSLCRLHPSSSLRPISILLRTITMITSRPLPNASPMSSTTAPPWTPTSSARLPASTIG